MALRHLRRPIPFQEHPITTSHPCGSALGSASSQPHRSPIAQLRQRARLASQAYTYGQEQIPGHWVDGAEQMRLPATIAQYFPKVEAEDLGSWLGAGNRLIDDQITNNNIHRQD
jgi:hypothetical protein